MKSSNSGLFISIFLILIGFNLLTTGEFSVKGNEIDLTKNNINIYLGGIFIFFSIIILYLSKKGNNYSLETNKIIEFSKCPKCKESFNYSELKKGKCNSCDDVDTIDIDEYYKQHPDEVNKKLEP